MPDDDMLQGGEAPRRSHANLIAIAAIVAIVAVSAMLTCAPVFLPGDTSAGYAIVHASDGTEEKFPLSEDSVHVIATDKGQNTVTVSDGEVYVSDADCDNHDCIRQGKISTAGQQIICLPHELWIEIVNDGEGSGAMDIDAVPQQMQSSSESGGLSAEQGFDGMSR